MGVWAREWEWRALSGRVSARVSECGRECASGRVEWEGVGELSGRVGALSERVGALSGSVGALSGSVGALSGSVGESGRVSGSVGA